jgi:hypothetical protein
LPPSGHIPSPSGMGMSPSHHQAHSRYVPSVEPANQPLSSQFPPTQNHTPLGLLKFRGFTSGNRIGVVQTTPTHQPAISSIQTELFVQVSRRRLI